MLFLTIETLTSPRLRSQEEPGVIGRSSSIPTIPRRRPRPAPLTSSMSNGSPPARGGGAVAFLVEFPVGQRRSGPTGRSRLPAPPSRRADARRRGRRRRSDDEGHTDGRRSEQSMTSLPTLLRGSVMIPFRTSCARRSCWLRASSWSAGSPARSVRRSARPRPTAVNASQAQRCSSMAQTTRTLVLRRIRWCAAATRRRRRALDSSIFEHYQ